MIYRQDVFSENKPSYGSVPNGAKHILEILSTLQSKQTIILKQLFRVG
jgi:hypothetical protein